MPKNNKLDMGKVFAEIASKNNVTVKEVKAEIKSAIEIGMSNQNPEIKREWASIPHKGKKPTPEEVILHLTQKVKSEI